MTRPLFKHPCGALWNKEQIITKAPLISVCLLLKVARLRTDMGVQCACSLHSIDHDSLIKLISLLHPFSTLWSN